MFIIKGNIESMDDVRELYEDGLISVQEAQRQIKLLSYRPFLTINAFRS